MPQIINTNIASINAQRNLDKSQGDNQTALQRLSSGLRINSAKDDAAGLAISTRFTAQVQGLAVAIRNASDGVSLAQTAEGALGSMTENLLRIRDLALQAANATNSKIDREALNQEVQQLKAELERVSLQTSFNGTKLLDGTFEDVTFQIGANEGENVSFGISGTTIDKLGSAATDGISSIPGPGFASDANGVPQAPALSAGDLVINGIAIGASSGIDDAFSNVDNAASAISKVAAINAASDRTGVSADIAGTFVNGASFTSADVAEDISINGIDISLSARAALSATVNLENIASVINEKTGQTGVEAVFSGNPAEGIQLRALDGRNIVIGDDSAGGGANLASFGLGGGNAAANTFTTFTGSFTLISADRSPIDIDTTTGAIANAGLAVGSFSGNNSGSVSSNVNATAMVAGDIVINGVPVGPSLGTYDSSSSTTPEASAISKARAINEVSEQTGVNAIVNKNILNGGALTAGTAITGTFDINGVTIDISVSAAASVTDIQNATIDAVNNKAGQSGVSAEAFGSTYRLVAEDGRNIEIDAFTGGVTANAGNLGLPATGTVTRGTISLESAGRITVETLTGDIANSGFQVGEYGSGKDGILVEDINISTVEGALLALDAVDNALNVINLQRANLGAIQNRFESTIENQQITSENLSASNSRIRDADFAAETAELSRTQVLQQAGLSILTQANSQPQNVLQLLQG